MTIFAEVDSTDTIIYVWEQDVPEVGPAPRMRVLPPEYRYEVLSELIDLHTPPSSTMVPKLVEGRGQWQETATLAELKDLKAAEITQAKIYANFAYFEYAGKRIAVDDASFRELQSTNGYIALFGEMEPHWPGGWKTMDDSYVIIPDVATWKLFYKAMYGSGLTNFNKSQVLKAEVRAATSPEELSMINW